MAVTAAVLLHESRKVNPIFRPLNGRSRILTLRLPSELNTAKARCRRLVTNCLTKTWPHWSNKSATLENNLSTVRAFAGGFVAHSKVILTENYDGGDRVVNTPH